VSDGTLVIDTRRFEVPNRYRHLREIAVRYASWDLSQVHLLDERSEQILCRLYPQDKQRNARAVRAPLEALAPSTSDPIAGAAVEPGAAGIAPLLEQLMAQQTATGLPPAYLPKDESPTEEGHDP